MQPLHPKLGENGDKVLRSNLQAHTFDDNVVTRSLQLPTSKGGYLTTKKTNKIHLITKN